MITTSWHSHVSNLLLNAVLRFEQFHVWQIRYISNFITSTEVKFCSVKWQFGRALWESSLALKSQVIRGVGSVLSPLTWCRTLSPQFINLKQHFAHLTITEHRQCKKNAIFFFYYKQQNRYIEHLCPQCIQSPIKSTSQLKSNLSAGAFTSWDWT